MYFVLCIHHALILFIVDYLDLSPLLLSSICCSGASTTDDILKIRLQLTKPVTWIPLIWGVLCGAAASGTNFVPSARTWRFGSYFSLSSEEPKERKKAAEHACRLRVPRDAP